MGTKTRRQNGGGAASTAALGTVRIHSTARLKLLVDTNIYIPLEPTQPSDIAANTAFALDFAQQAQLGGHTLFTHPEMPKELARDLDEGRRAVRQLVLARYPTLPCPPPPDAVELALGVSTDADSHDHVDHWMLAAVLANAVDYLVTEDTRIHRKAVRLGFAERVLRLAEAREFLRDLLDTAPTPPPHVRAVKMHLIDPKDPLFESIRRSYKGFDRWFAEAAKEHRDAWIIGGAGDPLAAVAIVKREEDDVVAGLDGRVLKICTLKVAATANGSKFGELLLKTIFEHARMNNYDGVFLTVFPEHAVLIELLQQFGFKQVATRGEGELVFAKTFCVDESHGTLDALQFHIELGPHAVRSFADQPTYIIPILPEFHDALFPDAAPQPSLEIASPKPFGCAMRKAYLCHSPLRRLQPGDNLLFYRSGAQHVVCTGVLEKSLVSTDAREIVAFVGTRTVYSFTEIERKCAHRAVLALLFRHSRILEHPIPLQNLCANSVLKGRPQSIVTVKNSAGRRWLETTLVAHT